nr:MAG TPA: hypothetical protein [Caudoviricetes sp.]
MKIILISTVITLIALTAGAWAIQKAVDRFIQFFNNDHNDA